MKLLELATCLTALISVALAVFLYNKHSEQLFVSKQAFFLDIKIRVTMDVLNEVTTDIHNLELQMDVKKNEIEALKRNFESDPSVDFNTAELEACNGEKKKLADEVAAIEEEKNNIQSQFSKEKANWPEQMAKIQKQLEEKSELCKFINKTSLEGMKLCGETEKNDIQIDLKPEASK